MTDPSRRGKGILFLKPLPVKPTPLLFVAEKKPRQLYKPIQPEPCKVEKPQRAALSTYEVIDLKRQEYNMDRGTLDDLDDIRDLMSRANACMFGAKPDLRAKLRPKYQAIQKEVTSMVSLGQCGISETRDRLQTMVDDLFKEQREAMHLA